MLWYIFIIHLAMKMSFIFKPELSIWAIRLTSLQVCKRGTHQRNLNKIECNDKFGPWLVACVYLFAGENDLKLVGVHRPNALWMRVWFFKFLLKKRICNPIVLLFAIIGSRMREQSQLQIPDSNADLVVDSVAGDDVLVFHHPKQENSKKCCILI